MSTASLLSRIKALLCRNLAILMVLGLLLAGGPALVKSLSAQEISFVTIRTLTQLIPDLDEEWDRLMAGDLVIFDLDRMVQREAQMLGSEEWYSARIAELRASGMSRREAAVFLHPLNLSIKSKSKVALMEAGLPAKILELQRRGVVVIAITARDRSMAEFTIQGLKDLGINFGNSQFPDGFRGRIENPALFHYEQGIAFTDGADKGEVLESLLEITRYRPARAWAFDDRLYNVESFSQTLDKLSIPGQVIHYDPTVSYDADLARIQFARFSADGVILSDAQASGILQSQEKCVVPLTIAQATAPANGDGK